MSMSQHTYGAFISYRHQSPDMEIAARLHKQIENYVIPSGIRQQSGKKRMGKVFRDQEELPLSADLGKDIEEALDNSEWLIAICTPAYLESRYACVVGVLYPKRAGQGAGVGGRRTRRQFSPLLRFSTDDMGKRYNGEPPETAQGNCASCAVRARPMTALCSVSAAAGCATPCWQPAFLALLSSFLAYAHANANPRAYVRSQPI